MIHIVSGLPRSGTSLMMRMLEAGGMPVLMDNLREADVDNPKGYYELERVKNVKQDALFLDEADGKVFKMVSMLLYDLPKDRPYRIVFMQRDLDEVIASQNKMLERLGRRKREDEDDDRTRELLARHLMDVERWLKEQSNMHLCYIQHHDLLTDSAKALDRLMRFFHHTLSREKMQAVIDPSLYRQRHAQRKRMRHGH